METPRAMMFVDGENLVMRYQDLVTKGRKPNDGVVHQPDCFVWHPNLTQRTHFNFVRVTYYSSVVGDDPRILEVKSALAKIPFTCRPGANVILTGQIVPAIFKKPAKSQKTRSVDIQIVIDIMRYAFSNSIELVYLASGDGDYLPLIAEVMRHGTQVYAGALSSGLHPEIPHSVDEFFDLDQLFFQRVA